MRLPHYPRRLSHPFGIEASPVCLADKRTESWSGRLLLGPGNLPDELIELSLTHVGVLKVRGRIR